MEQFVHTLHSYIGDVPSAVDAVRVAASPQGGGVVIPSAPALTIPTANLLTAVSAVKINGYAGVGLKVRRTSDGQTADIGYVNNVLDTIAADAFAAGSDLTIDTAYDHTATAHNPAQATPANQPRFTPLCAWKGIRPITSDRFVSRFLSGAGNLSGLSRNAFTIYLVIAPRTSWTNQSYYDLTNATPATVARLVSLNSALLHTGGSNVPAARNARSQIQIIAFSCDGAQCISRVAGKELVTTGVIAGSLMTNLRLGTGLANTPSGADLFFCGIYKAAHNSATMQSVEAALIASFGIPTAQTKKLVVAGTSMMVGQGGHSNQTPLYQAGFGAEALPEWEVVNMAIQGETLAQGYARIADYTAQYDATMAKNVAMIHDPTNDIGLQTFADQAAAETYADNLYTNQTLPFIAALKSAGFVGVVANTTVARGGFASAFREFARLRYNANLRNGAVANGYKVADRAGDARLSNSADLMYFDPDAIHLTNAGQGVDASIIKPQILAAAA